MIMQSCGIETVGVTDAVALGIGHNAICVPSAVVVIGLNIAVPTAEMTNPDGYDVYAGSVLEAPEMVMLAVPK